MITSFFPFLGFSPSGTQFYEAIVGSSSKPPFLLASKRKKNILTFFEAKKIAIIGALDFRKCIN
jgi:hypothetical protein